jgi:predicted ATPase
MAMHEEKQGNLPGDEGELIGRGDELEALRRWFEAKSRLVTILGPGGIGKTRLATHFGWQQMEARAWEGGVWLCNLTEASTVEDICHTLGEALGVSLSLSAAESEPAEQIGRALEGHGETLVILDNIEQLLQHLPDTLSRWLALAPRACFLTTSREALHLAGESILDLAPLGLPGEGASALEDIARAEAVRLFVQRARAARGDYALTAGEAPLVAEIVRRLDGIALAIELAAARTRLLSVGQVRERLLRRFELLRGGIRDASARQATLWGTIDWSWNLLDTTEQAALAQCSIFRGGFTLEAAKVVLALPSGSPDVLKVIEALREKFLLRMYVPEGMEDPEARLCMYDSIREYALARLKETGEDVPLMERHADFYLSLAGQLREQVHGARGHEALRRLSAERENLLAVCDNALAAPPTLGSVTRALGGVVVLEPDVTARGPVALTLSRLERALELAAQLPVAPLPRAEALATRGRTYGACGQVTNARRDLRGAKESFHALGEVAKEKRVLVDLSIIARNAGDLEAAWASIHEAMELHVSGDSWLEAYTVGNLGLVEQFRSGARAAVFHLRSALRLFRAVGDVMFESGFLTNCAVAVGEAGDPREAMTLLREAMDKATQAGDRVGYAIAHLNLGCFLLEEDRAREACEHLESTVRMSRQLGIRLLEGCARGELGRALLSTGAVEPAQSHLSDAVALLRPVARWHALRFSTHLAAVQAVAGRLSEAQAGFAELAATPEVQQDAVLFELMALLRAAVDLAESRAAPPGSEPARQALERARQRVERTRSVPENAASSDLRGARRFFERALAQSSG